MKEKRWRIYLILITGIIPSLVSAEMTFSDLSKKLYTDIVGPLVNVLMVATFVFFAWSVVRFIFSEGEKKDEAKNTLVWGVIALFVMMSMWGILRIINSTFTKSKLGEHSKYELQLDYQQYQPNGKIGN